MKSLLGAGDTIAYSMNSSGEPSFRPLPFLFDTESRSPPGSTETGRSNVNWICFTTERCVELAAVPIEVLTRNCILSVNEGFVRARTEWTHQNNVNTGDLEPEKKLAFEQIADLNLASDAVEKAAQATPK